MKRITYTGIRVLGTVSTVIAVVVAIGAPWKWT